MKKITISKEDHTKLYKTIIKVDAYRSLYDSAIEKGVDEKYVKNITSQFIDVLQDHKILWSEIVYKYIKDLEANPDFYKYDLSDMSIFLPENSGCGAGQC